MEAMTLEQAPFIAEIAGVLAIVASLVYLALQVRQNTRTTGLESVHAISTEFNNFYDMLASNGELADIYHRGVIDFQGLDTTQQMRFTLALTRVFRTFHEQYFQVREGAMDAEFWRSWEALFSDAVQYPGVQEVWSRRRHQFTENFQIVVDKLIAEPKNTKPLYDAPPPGSG